MTTAELTIPSFPARPVNGGALEHAGPKIGRWFVEPKYNGWRALVHAPTGTMFNRHGKRLTIEKEFATALARLHELNDEVCAMEWIDCEALERRHGIGRGCLIVLDILDEAKRPYEVRRELMSDLFNELFIQPFDFPVLSIPPLSADAAALWKELQVVNRRMGLTGLNEFYEGIVMKRADSLYPLQLRSADVETPYWIKHRWAA